MTPDQESSKLERFQVELHPLGCRVRAEAGTSLLAAARAGGVQLVAVCGGVGTCESCRIRLVRGELSAPTADEERSLGEEPIGSGMRLACQAKVLGDVEVNIPPESLSTPQRLQVEGEELAVEPDPIVVAVDVRLEPPTLNDPSADSSRLQAALERLGRSHRSLRLPVLKSLSRRLRELGWSPRIALRWQEPVAALPGGSDLLGVAIDIGTTKVAVYLVDLTSGRTVGKLGAMNPQIANGEDVISRIAYASAGAHRQIELQQRLLETINDMIGELCRESNSEPDQIVDAVAVGNTAMHHFFLGLPVEQLGVAPYVAALTESLDVGAPEVGLKMAGGGYVHLPPNIAGYVGADHVAMLLATGIGDETRTVLGVDVGTNTEITLAAKSRLLSCSCASGPAFEGAHIRCGMRAAAGAIEHLQILDGEIRVHTIDDTPAIGICGSGIVAAVAELVAAGALLETGRLRPEHPLVQRHNGKARVVLVPAERSGHGRDVIVTGKDVAEIQFAKGAIRAGIEVLLAEAGVSPSELDEIILAGAFGTYLEAGQAMRLGLIPTIPAERVRQVGNAAGAGAKQILVSARRRQMAAEIARRVEYVELTAHPRFSEEFLSRMSFK